MTKLKMVISILLAVSVLEGGGLLSYRAAAKEGPTAEVQTVLDKYRSIRPNAKDLGIFQLDWVPTLREAKKRAAKEQRPIFFVMVLNPFGNLYSGHC